ncbi:unnamed protein product, partial [Ectocarpus sp. 12 AP-2014]
HATDIRRGGGETLLVVVVVLLAVVIVTLGLRDSTVSSGGFREPGSTGDELRHGSRRRTGHYAVVRAHVPRRPAPARAAVVVTVVLVLLVPALDPPTVATRQNIAADAAAEVSVGERNEERRSAGHDRLLRLHRDRAAHAVLAFGGFRIAYSSDR